MYTPCIYRPESHVAVLRVPCFSVFTESVFSVFTESVFSVFTESVFSVLTESVFSVFTESVFSLFRVRASYVQESNFCSPICVPRVFIAQSPMLLCSESHVFLCSGSVFPVFRVWGFLCSGSVFFVFTVGFWFPSVYLVFSLFRFPYFSCVRGPCLLCSESRVFSAQNLLFSLFKVLVFSVLSLDPVFSVFYYCRPVCRRLSSRWFQASPSGYDLRTSLLIGGGGGGNCTWDALGG